MAKMVIHTPLAPDAVGPYSQAVSANGLVFCSGQVALDPDGGELVGGSVADETRQALKNLVAVLDRAGSSPTNVVKVTAYLTDMGDFAEFNDAYAEFFSSEPPARATVGVAALPKGARVEVECIALG
ncbi:MAG: reactive intermediate/imine deaminase [Chloroflexi bacterium]|jgi:2-iminobutanoate/2-iminopropanoate deaminase|nr:reactive intermediate/imine deaminase [Chloroflexota bacterium]